MKLLPNEWGVADKTIKISENEWGIADKTIKIKKYEFDSEMGIENFAEEDTDAEDNNGTFEDFGQKQESLQSGFGTSSNYSMMDKAKRDAEIIIANANKMVDEIRTGAEKEKSEAIEAAKKAGYEVGYREGQKEGEAYAKEMVMVEMNEASKEFLQELKDIITTISDQKEKFAKKYFRELCELTLSIAEKVIKVSLKSSGQVIERMIIAATEKSSNKQWANVHISDFDEKLLVSGDIDLLEAVKNISPNLKLEIVEGGDQGTCIVELPDQIIDASADTQLAKIKEIMEENQWDGEV